MVDQPDRRCRVDWVRVDPYRIFVEPGQTATIALLAENLHDEPIALELKFVTPTGIAVEPLGVAYHLRVGETHMSRHRVQCGKPSVQSPAILCVDVTLDGKAMGWLGHAQVWFEGTAG